MKRFVLSIISVLACAGLYGSETPAHPSLLIHDKDAFETIRERVKEEPLLQKIQAYILNFADETLPLPTNTRKMKGRRLLDTSADCFTRIFYLSYAWQITGKDVYARRAIDEMLAVSAFTDWNPSHFLDVAEMMCGLGFGYDWCYEAMTDAERETIRTALKEKGLDPCLLPEFSEFWLKSPSNWNQVCNAASVLAALAIRDTDPEYAETIVPRAVKAVRKAMACYAPDGAYREGPGYWCYGTSYNCLLLAAIENAYGTDYGLLDEAPAFMTTVNYHLAMMTPTSRVFCYADQAFPAQVTIVPFWMFAKTGEASYLYMLQHIFSQIPIDLAHCRHRRVLPAALVFAGTGTKTFPAINPPSWLAYVAGGRTPVAAFRSGWKSKDDCYLGFKCGSPKEGHNHMDEGSFYIEANGIRWAVDLGGEGYTNIERAGVDLWSYTADAGRWRLLRTGLAGHNCLILNGHDQNVDGYCQIDTHGEDFKDQFAGSDLSSLYLQDADSVGRTVHLLDGKSFRIDDCIVTKDKKVTLRWQMATEAVSLKAKGKQATLLSEDGKKMMIKVSGNAKVSFDSWSAQPLTSYEAKNEGRMFVGFTAQLLPGKKYTITTELIPL